jgi:hypothetical protein
MQANKEYDTRVALVEIWECGRSQIFFGKDKDGNLQISLAGSWLKAKVGKSKRALSQLFPGRRIDAWQAKGKVWFRLLRRKKTFTEVSISRGL